MQQKTKDDLIQPIIKFFVSSFVILSIGLFISSFFLARNFIQREKERAGIISEQIEDSINTEYRYIVEEFFTNRYESILLRVQRKLDKLGVKEHRVILTNKLHDCVFSYSSINDDVKCENTYREVFSEVNKSVVIQKDNKLVYYSELILSTEKIGYIYIELSDKYKFFNGSPIIYIKDNFIPLFIVVLFFWSVAFLVSWKVIIKPYMKTLLEIEKKKTSSETLAQIVHDTKYDIETILNISDELQKDKDRNINEKGQELKSLVTNVQDLFSNIQKSDDGEIKDFSLPDYYRVESSLEKAYFRALKLHKDKAKITLNINFDKSKSKDLFLYVQEGTFVRVLLNIITNSIEHISGSKDGVVNIDTDISSNNDLVITIEDNGQGISESIKNDLFEKGTTTKENGTGRGLSFVKNSVEEWKGDISFGASDLGGAKFIVKIPLTKRKYVILEDHEKSQKHYRNYMERNQKDFLIFGDPHKLLEVANSFSKVDVMIFDYNLESDLKGTDVAKRLKESGLNHLFIRSGSHVVLEEHPYLKAVLERNSIDSDMEIIYKHV